MHQTRSIRLVQAAFEVDQLLELPMVCSLSANTGSHHRFFGTKSSLG
jgi:hypothetical protein